MIRPVLYTITAVTGVFFLAAAMAIIFFDINAYRLQVQSAAAAALGVEVGIGGGPLSLGFSTGPYINLSDVTIRRQGIDIATIPEARLGIDLIPLLFQEVSISSISLVGPVFSIVRDLNGDFNFESPEDSREDSPRRPFSGGTISGISVDAGTFHYFDARSEFQLEVAECSLQAQDLHLTGDSANLLKQLSFSADLACGTILKNGLSGHNLKMRALASHGELVLDPITMNLLGGTGSGNLVANFGDSRPSYKLDYAVTGLLTEALFQSLTGTSMLKGPVDLTIRLDMEGDTYQHVIRSAAGQFSLVGVGLTLTGSDLDSQINQFESSQNLNLIDAGAFFFIGPLGLLASKGYDFASLMKGSQGTSKIVVLVSDWTVERGEAEAQDVALATHQHRLALHGRLDFVNEAFKDVNLAVVDLDGCAQVQQKITGRFQQPVIESPGAIDTITGPIQKLVKKGISLVNDLDCEVFYDGRVSPPV